MNECKQRQCVDAPQFIENFQVAFCLRVLRKKCFNVNNRWYEPALRGRKSQNGGGFHKFFGVASLRNLCKRVRKSTKWFRGVS